MSHDEHTYHAKDALGPAVKAGMTTGVVGVMFSGIQSALTKQNLGPMGAFTRYGGTAAIFSMLPTPENAKDASFWLQLTNELFFF
jgi:hypothetical protein